MTMQTTSSYSKPTQGGDTNTIQYDDNDTQYYTIQPVDPSRHADPPYLWVPYFLLSACLLGLVLASFIRFHVKNRSRYRDRKSRTHDLQHFDKLKRTKRSSVTPNEEMVVNVIKTNCDKSNTGSSIKNQLQTKLRDNRHVPVPDLRVTSSSPTMPHIKCSHRQPLLLLTGNFHGRTGSRNNSISDSSPVDNTMFSYHNQAYDSNDDASRSRSSSFGSRSTSIGSRDDLIVNQMSPVSTTPASALRNYPSTTLRICGKTAEIPEGNNNTNYNVL